MVLLDLYRSIPARRLAPVQRVTGVLLMLFSMTMLPPVAVDLLYDEDAFRAFLATGWITLATGFVLWWPVRRVRNELKIRDGFLITVLFWTVLGAFGAIPLYLSDTLWNHPTDALFESMSGLTTTGTTTVAAGLDALPKAINFYRVQLHWLGGMGIIVLAVAILPMLGIGGMQLFRAEIPGPMKNNKLTPRITETARVLWLVYLSLTVTCGVVYWLLGMTPFDAMCHALSTLATGGFSSHDASIGFYNSPALECAVIVFMLLGTINFATHFGVWRHRSVFVYWRDSEFRACLTVILGYTLLISIPLLIAQTFDDTATTLRTAAFHVVSYGTNTGFTTTNASLWPSYAPMMLMLCGFMVGCSGSTSGGVKMVRLMLFVKQALREVQRLIHPNAQLPIKLDGRVVDDSVVYAIGGFFSVYIGFTILLSFAMMATGLEPVEAFSAVAATINNMGPGLGSLSGSVAEVSDPGKWIMMFSMLLGRLEIFTLLIVFTPAFWRR